MDVGDALGADHRALDRPGDQVFHLLGDEAGRLGVDDRLRRRKVGQQVHPDIAHIEEAERQEPDAGQPDQARSIERPADKPFQHG